MTFDSNDKIVVEENGSLVINSSGINFNNNFSVTDDGDGTSTIEIAQDGITPTELDTEQTYVFGVNDNDVQNRLQLENNKALGFYNEDDNETGFIGYFSAIGWDLSFEGFSTISYDSAELYNISGISSLTNIFVEGDGVTVEAGDDAANIDFDTTSNGTTATAGRFTADGSGNYFLDMNSNNITSVANPSNAQDASTKDYVDNTHGGTSDAHHSRYSDEEAQDAVGTITTGSGATSVTYDDANNELNISSTDSDTTYSAGNGLSLSDGTFSLDILINGTAADNIYGIDFGDGLYVSNDGDNTVTVSNPDTISLNTGMTEWADGLSNEEIDRLVLQSGESFVVDRIEVRQKGGGSSSSFSVRVQDSTAASTIGSQTLGGTTKDPGSSGTGNTVLTQVSNSTGGVVEASIKVVGRIQGA